MGKPNPELVKYIEEHNAKGFDIKSIKKALAEAGHPIEAIEDAASSVLHTAPPTRRKISPFMIVYGLILILIISGAIWFAWFKITEYKDYSAQVQTVEQTTQEKAAQQTTLAAMDDVGVMRYAQSNNDTSACEYVEDHNKYYACVDRYWELGGCKWEMAMQEARACVSNLAVSEINISKCNRLKTTEDKTACQEAVFSAILNKGDISLCNSADCEHFFLSRNPSITECTKRHDAATCWPLLAELNNNSAYCANLKGVEQSDCYADNIYNYDDIINFCTTQPQTDTDDGLFSFVTDPIALCYLEELDVMMETEKDCQKLLQKVDSDERTKNYLSNIRQLATDLNGRGPEIKADMQETITCMINGK